MQNNRNEYKTAFQNLPAGVDAVEVSEMKAKSFEIGLRDGEIDNYNVNSTDRLSLRADCGQIGTVYTEAHDEPMTLIVKAQENAEFITNEDAEFMRFYEGDKEYQTIEPVDARLDAMSAEEKIEYAFALEEKVKALDKRITKVETQIETSTMEVGIFNSLGLDVSMTKGVAFAASEPIVEQDGEIHNGFAYAIANAIEDLDFDRLAKEAVEDAVSQFGAKSIPSGTYNIVVKNKAMGSLLGVFSSLFNAEAAQKGLSLLAGKENEKIVSDLITIVDDPMDEHSFFKSPFDDEGVAAQRTNVVDHGVLKTLLHNRKTAAKEGVATTGNCSGGSSVSPSNFIVQAGTSSLDELVAHVKDGIYIVEFSGLHSGANPISGDFSLLFRGFIIKDGKIAEPVEQITLAANFIDMMNQVTELGNDLRYAMSSMITPSIAFENMQVAGK